MPTFHIPVHRPQKQHQPPQQPHNIDYMMQEDSNTMQMPMAPEYNMHPQLEDGFDYEMSDEYYPGPNDNFRGMNSVLFDRYDSIHSPIDQEELLTHHATQVEYISNSNF
jgi:hypothetical protein